MKEDIRAFFINVHAAKDGLRPVLESAVNLVWGPHIRVEERAGSIGRYWLELPTRPSRFELSVFTNIVFGEDAAAIVYYPLRANMHTEASQLELSFDWLTLLIDVLVPDRASEIVGDLWERHERWLSSRTAFQASLLFRFHASTVILAALRDCAVAFVVAVLAGVRWLISEFVEIAKLLRQLLLLLAVVMGAVGLKVVGVSPSSIVEFIKSANLP